MLSYVAAGKIIIWNPERFLQEISTIAPGVSLQRTLDLPNPPQNTKILQKFAVDLHQRGSGGGGGGNSISL